MDTLYACQSLWGNALDRDPGEAPLQVLVVLFSPLLSSVSSLIHSHALPHGLEMIRVRRTQSPS